MAVLLPALLTLALLGLLALALSLIARLLAGQAGSAGGALAITTAGGPTTVARVVHRGPSASLAQVLVLEQSPRRLTSRNLLRLRARALAPVAAMLAHYRGPVVRRLPRLPALGELMVLVLVLGIFPPLNKVPMRPTAQSPLSCR
jgi:hypothetical protein